MYIENYLKMDELKDGFLYRIIARNSAYGIWVKERQAFIIARHKFYDEYLFEEHHYDCKDFATAQPVEEIEKAPFDVDTIYNNGPEVIKYLSEFSLKYME